jgi:hypothetical protein
MAATVADDVGGLKGRGRRETLTPRPSTSGIAGTVVRLVQSRKGGPGLAVLIILALTAIFAPQLARFNPNGNNLLAQLARLRRPTGSAPMSWDGTSSAGCFSAAARRC